MISPSLRVTDDHRIILELGGRNSHEVRQSGMINLSLLNNFVYYLLCINILVHIYETRV